VLGKDVGEYEKLLENIRQTFIRTYQPRTQTECALALVFSLTDDKVETVRRLASLIEACGGHLQTGFVGTPYLLHALSDNGYTELAYDLLLREQFPSWLYSVKCGATTVWEHWNGQDENGELYSPSMNSFNHYAYGAVADWIYGVAAGITPLEAGYKRVCIAPNPTQKLPWLEVRYATQYGEINVKWKWQDDVVHYEIETPVSARIIIGGKTYEVEKGKYNF
jgi:alpha-L-rhamnosidase